MVDKEVRNINKKTGEIDIKEISLLSVEEAKKISERNRCADKLWWLRSPGYDKCYAAFVFGVYGNIHEFGCEVFKEFGVRPALYLQSDNLQTGKRFNFLNYGWTILLPKVALCDNIVGKCAFRSDMEGNDLNNYEKSDIKKWLDRWLRDKIGEI